MTDYFFDLETHTALQTSTTQGSLFTGYVHEAWNIGDNPNGGYLISITLDALTQSLPHPHPLTLTTHFLRPGTADAACEIHIEILRTGRTLSTARATLIQAGKTRLEILATYGDLNDTTGVDDELVISPPELPAPEACEPRTGEAQGIHLPISERLDVRLAPTLASTRQQPVQQATISGWIACRDGRAPETRLLPMFTDAFPPSVFTKLGIVGWVPTVELTVHIRRPPATGWIKGSFTTRDLSHGRMLEDGCLWDNLGNLVAQSRQIGLVLQRDA